METITLTQQEIWMVTRTSVCRSKKTYKRREKHKNRFIRHGEEY
jgi:hypothetical protein